jgi:protein SCO1/2
MNDRAPRRARLPILLMLAAASLAACQAAGGEPSAEGGLVGSSVGGPFSLTDQDGKRVSDTDFAGRYRIVYFGFANCPDVCPSTFR